MHGSYRNLGYILFVFPLIIVAGFWFPYFSPIPTFNASITTAATNALDHDADIAKVQEWLGRTNIATTRIYDRRKVKCKQWRAQQVPVTIVRELYGVMAAQHAAGGYVVTSGRFTKDAIAFAEGRNIELIDRETLPALLRKPQDFSATPAIAATKSIVTPTPACPQCKEPMVARVANRGANQGSEFWGCRRYPKCTATLAKI